VAECRRFPGWALEATRAFAPGEVVYRYELRLLGPESRVLLHTELGSRLISFPEYGVPFTVESVGELGGASLRELARRYALEPADHEGLWRRLTGGGRRGFLFAGFDELINHSDDPSCAFAPEPARLHLDGPEPTSEAELVALRAIGAGDELTVDYRTLLPGWTVPAGWAP
jgi:hypothetical protein